MSDQPASHSQPVVLSTSHRPEMSSFVPSNLNDELPTLPPVRNFIKSVPRMKRKKPIKKRQRFSDCLPTLPPAQDLIESVLRMERENIIRERQQQGLPIDDNTIDILIKQLEEDGRERAEESNAILKDTYNCSAIPISQPPARKCLPQPLIVPDTEPQSEATTLNPPAPNLPLAPLVPPFVARVDVIDSGPCLQWPSPVERKGYPVVDIRVLEDAYQLVTRRMKETIEKLPGRCSQDCVYPDSRLYRRLYNLLFAAPSFPVSLLRPLIAYSICGSDIHANIRQVLDVNPPLYNRHVIQFRSRKAAPGSHGVPLLDVFYDLGSLEGEANMPLLPIKDYINLSLVRAFSVLAHCHPLSVRSLCAIPDARS
ncbi:hypothetical protein AX15_002273 [Amanita polypyramis BW_CC]|nr:hypothetical protein AX15_002273 [Amanita polypyramis BW_CC]